jgi:hypothetical protein
VIPVCEYATNDPQAVGTGRVERTIPEGFSADEGLEIGKDLGSLSSPDYGPRGNVFDGPIAWVQRDVGTTTPLLIELVARAALNGTRPQEVQSATGFYYVAVVTALTAKIAVKKRIFLA